MALLLKSQPPLDIAESLASHSVMNNSSLSLQVFKTEVSDNSSCEYNLVNFELFHCFAKNLIVVLKMFINNVEFES